MRHTHQCHRLIGGSARATRRERIDISRGPARAMRRRVSILVPLALLPALAAIHGPPRVATAQATTARDAVRPRLERPTEPISATTFHAAGIDPAPPRALTLWRWNGERFLRLAETRSAATGAFDFGIQPLPLVHAEYAVVPSAERPAPADLVAVERAIPPPIVADFDPADARLLLLPARAEGELRLRDRASGRLLARVVVDPASSVGTTVDLERTLPRRWPEALEIEHVLADGRRSAATVWPLVDPLER